MHYARIRTTEENDLRRQRSRDREQDVRHRWRILGAALLALASCSLLGWQLTLERPVSALIFLGMLGLVPFVALVLHDPKL